MFQISSLSGIEIGDVGVGICAHLEMPIQPSPVHLRHSKNYEGEKIKTHYMKKGSRHPRRTNFESPYWVIDANHTALVTPKVWAGTGCSCRKNEKLALEDTAQNELKNTPEISTQPLQIKHSSVGISTCHPDPCLNGGRCIISLQGPR